MLRRVFLILVIALFAFGARAQLQTYDKGSLTIDTAQGKQRFTVEFALTPEQQEQGLMYRSSLAPDAGMLFVFEQSRTQIFWMKNTLIPLDMVFIAANGRIVDFHERAVPMDETPIPSKAPALAVLELNGGTVARLGIKIGDVVHAAAFGNAN